MPGAVEEDRVPRGTTNERKIKIGWYRNNGRKLLSGKSYLSEKEERKQISKKEQAGDSILEEKARQGKCRARERGFMKVNPLTHSWLICRLRWFCGGCFEQSRLGCRVKRYPQNNGSFWHISVWSTCLPCHPKDD